MFKFKKFPKIVTGILFKNNVVNNIYATFWGFIG